MALKKREKSLLTRLLTISVAIPIAVTLLASPTTAKLLLLTLFGLSIYEFFELRCFSDPGISAVFSAAAAVTAVAKNSVPGVLALMFVHATSPSLYSTPPSKVLLSCASIAYISAGFHALIGIAVTSLPHALYFCAVIWLSDTGALLCGKYLPTVPAPLFLRAISPGKTTTGYLGGAATTLASVLLLSGKVPHTQSFGVPSQAALFFVLSTAGDLVESFMKRSAGVKDSGVIFPGHGGALDRMDSMILIAPVYLFLYVKG